ncbi:MAG: uroporphyrinogen-III C-methyltransferase, partial [SAR324 cluster bacterium]
MTSVSYQHSEKFPLAGLRFLVTRQDSTESSLSGMLESQGASVLTAKMTQIIPTESWELFDETVQQISNIDWVVFTSRNGVTHCLSRLND